MLEARNISKEFSGVKALSGINLCLYPGKVNAIIGENGAGKSTLMKILSGVHAQYDGDIIYNQQKLQFANTKEAETAGIAIIHQELNLVPYLTIAENIFLGKEIVNRFGLLQQKEMLQATAELLQRLNLSIDPSTKVAELKVGQQQLVEIAKALHTNASVIIMDEPTSAISDKEVENLFSIIHELKGAGKIIVYISHKLNELFKIADCFVVLRDGKTIESGNMQEITKEGLLQKMTGRTVEMQHRISKSEDAEELFSINHLCLQHANKKGQNILNNISLNLHKGEILGIYGLMGAGRTELLETIFGIYPKLTTGTFKISTTKQTISSPADAIKAGIVLVPEDRKLQGLFLNQSVEFNISITILEILEKFGIVLNADKENGLAKNYIEQLNIKTASTKTAARNLSGGNQQKIVLAKWLATNPKILLLDEPTRGVDVNAKAEIYKLMKSLADAGLGIIMASSELPEILAVSDRVLVMCEGEITANVPIDEASESEILKYAIHNN